MKSIRKFEINNNEILVDGEIKIGVAKYGDTYTVVIENHMLRIVRSKHCSSEKEFQETMNNLEENIIYPVYKDGKLICKFHDYEEAKKFVGDESVYKMDAEREYNPNYTFSEQSK